MLVILGSESYSGSFTQHDFFLFPVIFLVLSIPMPMINSLLGILEPLKTAKNVHLFNLSFLSRIFRRQNSRKPKSHGNDVTRGQLSYREDRLGLPLLLQPV